MTQEPDLRPVFTHRNVLAFYWSFFQSFLILSKLPIPLAHGEWKCTLLNNILNYVALLSVGKPSQTFPQVHSHTELQKVFCKDQQLEHMSWIFHSLLASISWKDVWGSKQKTDQRMGFKKMFFTISKLYVFRTQQAKNDIEPSPQPITEEPWASS